MEDKMKISIGGLPAKYLYIGNDAVDEVIVNGMVQKFALIKGDCLLKIEKINNETKFYLNIYSLDKEDDKFSIFINNDEVYSDYWEEN